MATLSRKREERSSGVLACLLGGQPSERALGYLKRPGHNPAGVPTS
jgi:hypothetical protein